MVYSAEVLRLAGYQPDPYTLTPGQIIFASRVRGFLEGQKLAADIQSTAIGSRSDEKAIKSTLKNLGVDK